MKLLNKQILESIRKGINLAIDDFDSLDTIEVQKKARIKDDVHIKDFIYFIDLGLPSGTLWAKYNLGVNPNMLNNPEDWYGNYYAWGETETKPLYYWTNYKYGSSYDKLFKYNINQDLCAYNYIPDNLVKLLPEDDAAIQNNHTSLSQQMPSKQQFQELMINCKFTWIQNYQNVEGLNGELFTGPNGKQIFFPAAGRMWQKNINYSGEECFLWTIDLHPTDSMYALYFHFNNVKSYELDTVCRASDRAVGLTVRPVL